MESVLKGILAMANVSPSRIKVISMSGWVDMKERSGSVCARIRSIAFSMENSGRMRSRKGLLAISLPRRLKEN